VHYNEKMSSYPFSTDCISIMSLPSRLPLLTILFYIYGLGITVAEPMEDWQYNIHRPRAPGEVRTRVRDTRDDSGTHGRDLGESGSMSVRVTRLERERSFKRAGRHPHYQEHGYADTQDSQWNNFLPSHPMHDTHHGGPVSSNEAQGFTDFYPGSIQHQWSNPLQPPDVASYLENSDIHAPFLNDHDFAPSNWPTYHADQSLLHDSFSPLTIEQNISAGGSTGSYPPQQSYQEGAHRSYHDLPTFDYGYISPGIDASQGSAVGNMPSNIFPMQSSLPLPEAAFDPSSLRPLFQPPKAVLPVRRYDNSEKGYHEYYGAASSSGPGKGPLHDPTEDSAIYLGYNVKDPNEMCGDKMPAVPYLFDISTLLQDRTGIPYDIVREHVKSTILVHWARDLLSTNERRIERAIHGYFLPGLDKRYLSWAQNLSKEDISTIMEGMMKTWGLDDKKYGKKKTFAIMYKCGLSHDTAQRYLHGTPQERQIIATNLKFFKRDYGPTKMVIARDGN
jgi:hypothetical protein